MIAVLGALKSAKAVAIGLAGVAVLGLVVGFWWNYRSLETDAARQAARASSAEAAAATDAAAIAKLREQAIDQAAAQAAYVKRLEALERDQAAAAAELDRLGKVLSAHDLGKLANEKPGLVRDRVNAGTDRINRLLECATGAGGDGCGSSAGGAGGAASPSGAGEPRASQVGRNKGR